MSDVFILGAGFSRQVSGSMPLTNELAVEILNAIRNRPDDYVSGLLKRDFESALTYLAQSKPWIPESENLRHKALFLDISYAIGGIIDERCAWAITTLNTERDERILQLIGKWQESRATVLTLNYDILVEFFAQELGLETDLLYPGFLVNGESRNAAILRPEHRDTFSLLKLHGSINWFYSGRENSYGEAIYWDRVHADRYDHWQSDLPRQDSQTLADKIPFIVPPVSFKSSLMQHESIKSIWAMGASKIEKAKRLIIFGYSLPKSDIFMEQYLGSTVSADTEIWLVNPDPKIEMRFGELFRRDIRAFSGPSCFSDFCKEFGVNVPQL